MTAYARFSEPADAPYTPKRHGVFELCEASFDATGDEGVFLAHPEKGSIRCKMRFAYDIYAGEDEPNLRQIFWFCADIGEWKEIVWKPLFHAAWTLLETPEVEKLFYAWAAEKSEEVPPLNINVFAAELRRAREVAA